jgi:lipoprotein-anchoring transpeptidase ErfK/SrfK
VEAILRPSFFATLALLISLFPAAADVVITIDKSAQRMTVAVDGATGWSWPVSTGARGYDTPNGSYTAFQMEKDYTNFRIKRALN